MNGYNGLKDVRNLFDQNDDDNDIYEDIEYLFSEYEEIKEYANDIYEIIKQEEVNYEHEHIEEVNYVKLKPYLIDDEQIIIDCEYIVVEEKKVECCKVEDQNDIGYEEYKMLMSVKAKKEIEIIEDKTECEIIEDEKVDYYELVEDKKDEEFSKNGLKYEEIKRLLDIVLKKEEDKYLSKNNGLEYEEIKKLIYVIRIKEYSKYCLEYDEIIEEKIECCESTDQNDGYCEIIEDEVIEHQKVEDINMLKSSKNESDKIKELGFNNGRIKSNCKKNRC